MPRLTTAAALATLVALTAADAALAGNGWEGRRTVSRQRPNDLFYNHYVGPQPSGTAAQMYVSPLPAPAHVGHHYTTYQPLMPHEFTYGHTRSYWTHHPGAGWTRAKVRYGTGGNLLQAATFGLFDDTAGGWLQKANWFTHHNRLQAFDY